MQRLIESYIATLRKAVSQEAVPHDAILLAYRKVRDYYLTSPSGEKAVGSDGFWATEIGQLLGRARVIANGDLLTIAEFAREAGRSTSTISGWVYLGKLESLVDPDRLGRRPCGGFQRLIPRSELPLDKS